LIGQNGSIKKKKKKKIAMDEGVHHHHHHHHHHKQHELKTGQDLLLLPTKAAHY
jgi:hypothetical protein